MDCRSYKINDSLRLTHICTDRFKKARVSVSVTFTADKELSPLNSMMLPVAFLGTEKYKNFRTVCKRAEELYAADINDFNIMRGELQTVGLTALILNDAYETAEDKEIGFSVLDGTFELLSELVEKPLFRDTDVETEKLNRINRIKSRRNDAFGWAKYRFTKLMFDGEPCGYPLGGELEQVEAITADMVKKRHSEILRDSEIEIFYCGNADMKKIISLTEKYFGGISSNAVPLVRIEPIRRANRVRQFNEDGEYRQGNLLVGFRTGVVLSDPEFYALELLNQIFGDGPMSKLFLNVREKKSLCYFCASSYDEERGVIIVGCGIDNGDRDIVIDEILTQLEEIANGNITDAEMSAAVKAIESDCRAAEDHPGDYEDFYRTEKQFGGPRTIEEYLRGIKKVTKDEMINAAKNITLDTVYFLRGTLAGGDGDE